MFRLYRDLTVIYWCGAIAAFLLCVGVATWLSILTALPVIIGYLVACIVVLAWAIYLDRKATHRLNALRSNLLDQCRIREYLDAYHQFLSRPCAGKRAIRNLLLNNMAIGYNALGDDTESIRLARQVNLPANPTKPQQQADHLIHLHNMAKYYLDAGNITDAKRTSDTLKHMMSTVKPEVALLTKNMVYLLEMRLRLSEGNFEGIRVALEIELSNENRPLSRIGLCRDLAYINAHEGNIEKAKEHLIYIQQYGGDSRYVPWATEKLKAWNS